MVRDCAAGYGSEVSGAGEMDEARPSPVLRFVPPPGWPSPDEDWTAGHQGWQPRADWVPVAGLPAAPDGWRFWEPNPPVWRSLTDRPRRRAHLSAAIAVVALLIGSILTVRGVLDPAARGTAFVVYPLVALAGVLGLIRYPFELVRITRSTTAVAVDGAAPEMHRRDRAAYDQYLANDPGASPALSYDAFADAKEHRAWGADPAAVTRPRGKEDAGAPEFTSMRREPLAIAAGAVGALALIGLLILVVLLGRSLLPGAPAQAGAVGFTVSETTDADLEGLSCGSDIGCWTFRVTLDAECPGTATAIVEFAESESGAPTAQESFDLDALDDGTTAVLVVPAQSDSPDYASVTSVTCS